MSHRDARMSPGDRTPHVVFVTFKVGAKITNQKEGNPTLLLDTRAHYFVACSRILVGFPFFQFTPIAPVKIYDKEVEFACLM